MIHTSVLLNEVIAGLDIKQDDVCLDGTINGGGHSEAILKMLSENGTLIGLDMDNVALGKAKERLHSNNNNVILKQYNFRNLDAALKEARIDGVDKILLDLGLSSNQLDESGRGFTFRKEEPLLMTFNDKPATSELTAFDIVNKWDKENIAQIIESYGEERFSRRIAERIVEAREKKEIKTTKELADIVASAVPKKYGYQRTHPATKTFQAIRITVNDEIGALRDGLERGFKCLKPGGRMAIISFHSIEDRMVKNFFRQKAKDNEAILITKRPIVPEREEVVSNPRSRSAKLRIIEKNK